MVNMEKSGIQNFACYTVPATFGSRWKRWLASFALYAHRKGIILCEDSPAATWQIRPAQLLHLAEPDVQDVFSTLTDNGETEVNTECGQGFECLLHASGQCCISKAYISKVATQKPGETVQQFATCLGVFRIDTNISAAIDFSQVL